MHFEQKPHMYKLYWKWSWLCCFCLFAGLARGAEPASGWRGNATGLWPDSAAPLEWRRIAHGAMEGLRVQASRPTQPIANDAAPLVQKGLMNEWLTLGPLPVHHSVENFDDDLLGKEADIAPTAGDKTAGRAWQHLKATVDDPLVFGNAGLPWVTLVKIDESKPNQVAYAQTNLYSPRGGPVRGVVEHCYGLKVLLNGQQVYRAPEFVGGIGAYEPISRRELANSEAPSGIFACELKPGWNRLLLKLTTDPRESGHKEIHFCLRLMDPPSVNYETQNIRWMSELPGRSTSTPIIVEDRIFLAAEPDLLVCLDKRSGKLLWSAANNYYEALTPAERQALPALNTQVDPLVTALKVETDRSQRLILRNQIQQALVKIDPARFELQTDGHFAAHFGIVGFTMPTPVSDGNHVYVWCGLGVAACYDLDGRRQWMTRVPTGPLEYGSSPALADGVLAVFLGKLHGLDAKTGALKWTQPRVNKNIAAVLATTFAGRQVFVTQLGEVVRPADGTVIFRPRGASSGDGGCWGPPVILGDLMYSGKYGVKQMSVYDFSKVSGDVWKPELKSTIELNLPREHSLLPDGSWVDRSTAGSPLIHQGLAYLVDIYGWLYVADLATGETVYYQNLELNGLMHYNSVPVAASATLIGDHIVVLDNQGTAAVLEPGRKFKVVARNRIETQLERPWPIPSQETLAYAPPIADKECLYLRGERYLYCVGKKSD
jgi:outer membrane protein assembly factor BamB